MPKNRTHIEKAKFLFQATSCNFKKKIFLIKHIFLKIWFRPSNYLLGIIYSNSYCGNVRSLCTVLMSALAFSSIFIIWMRFPSSSSILVNLSSTLLMSWIWLSFSQTSVAIRLLNCSSVWDPGLSLNYKNKRRWDIIIIFTWYLKLVVVLFL